MNSKQGLMLSALAVALSGCSSLAERQVASGGFEYTKATTGVMLQVPGDLDAPEFSRQYELPQLGENAPTNLIGNGVKVTSPRLVLPLVSGSRIEEGTKSAMVKFDQVDDSEPLDKTIWNTLIGFLDENNIAVNAFDPDTGSLITDWMIITQDEDSPWYSWNSTQSETGRRFEFQLAMAPHGRTAELNVALKDYKKTINENVVESIEDIQLREQEVNILNQVIGFYEYQLGLETSRRIAKIRNGLSTELGFNADGDPAFLVDEIFDVTWPRLLLVLRNLGFDVKDLDKSTGLLFVTYNGSDGGWWSSLFTGDDEILDLGDYRLLVNEQGPKTAVTFMNEQSEPFAANEVADLFKPFSEVMSKDNLDI